MTMRHSWPLDANAVTVEGGGLTATFSPNRGGKITSLVDANGREWLASPNRPVGPPAREGASFLDGEMAGWDECAPTIVACSVDGARLADHGNLWTRAFTVSDATVSLHDEALQYEFARTVAAAPMGLELHYEVSAADRDVPFLWAAHPQFAASAGTRVELPDTVTSVVDVLDPDLPVMRWRPSLGSIDDVELGGYRKLYVHPEQHVRTARLVHANGDALQISWTDECPYLGLWFDHAALRREAIIAVEPATAYFDSLDTALRLGRAPVIAAGSTLAWTVSLVAMGPQQST